MKRLTTVLILCLLLTIIPCSSYAAGNHPFADVKNSDWYNDAVQFVYNRGLMKGTNPTTFSPEGRATRGMVVTILHNLENNPDAETGAFSDVADSAWYAKAVAWAAENGIVSGYGGGLFGPDDPVTREQMAVILNRYSEFKGYDYAAQTNLSDYDDVEKISSYARKSMAWANAWGIINGSGSHLMPKGYANRAQIAAMLMNFCKTDWTGQPPMASAEVSIARQDFVYTSPRNGATNAMHYDLVTVLGNSPAAQKINKAIRADFRAFQTAGDSVSGESYYFMNSIGIRHEWLSMYVDSDQTDDFFPCTVAAEVTQNGGGVLSIQYTARYLYDYYCEYGLTFDLNTGEQISYLNYFQKDKSKIISTIRTYLQDLVNNPPAMFMHNVEAALVPGFDFSRLDFYIDGRELVVCSPRIMAGDGTVWNESIHCGIYIGA
ncbi:MAG: S-layer homology domain-containing protein [Bacillota bacterium]|nr:S-layer homology domain-containing protein [Bacillota bacterium]